MRRGSAALACAAGLVAASGSAWAVDLTPGALHGRWGLATTDACEIGRTMVFAASGGLASTYDGSANRLEGVGTWTLQGQTLFITLSLARDPAVTDSRAVTVISTAPDALYFSDPAASGARLVFYRCQG